MNISYLKTTDAIGDATERFLCSRGLKRVIGVFLILSVIYFAGIVIINIINR